MCWSAQASFNTFLFATFGLVFGLINNYNLKLLLFIYCFSTMQFIEYNLWNKLSTKESNEFWSKVGYALILLQPYFAINIMSDTAVRNTLFALYTLFIGLTSHRKDFNTTVGKNGHLSWNWLEFPYTFWIVWLSFLGLPLLLEKQYLLSILGSLTFAGSYYFYAKDKTFASMWCWIVTFVWFIIMGDSSGLTQFTRH